MPGQRQALASGLRSNLIGTMKLLIYCKDYAPVETGFSIAFRGMCEALARHPEIEMVHVVTPIPSFGKPDVHPQGIKLTRLPHRFEEDYGVLTPSRAKAPRSMRPWARIGRLMGSVVNRWYWAQELARLQDQGQYDLLLFESADDVLVLASLPARCFRKLAIRIHSTGDTESAFYGTHPMRRLERLLLRNVVAPKVRAFFSTNRFHLRFVKEHYYERNPFKIASRYFSVIDNVVDDTFVQAEPEGLSSVRRIVTLGRMDRDGVVQKGFEDLLFALARVPEELRSNLRLSVIGDGPQRSALEHLATTLALGESVEFCGRLPNDQVRAQLVSAHVVALASRFEGQSMFAVEGLYAGCAALFSNAGALPDLIDGNGWSFDVQDIDQLAARLTDIANEPVSQLIEKGRRSRVMAQSRFRPEAVAMHAVRELKNARLFLEA